MKKYVKRLLYILLITLLSLSFIYLNTYYKAENRVYDLIKNSNIKVENQKDGFYFDGNGEKDLVIFYPGAKVEAISYAPLLIKLAENNIDCYLVKMPFNIAILNSGAANNIIKKYNYKKYYMMGHSLGGAMASIYTSKNEDKINSLILLASYSTKKIKVNTLSIYGSLDNVLNIKNYKKNKSNISNITEYIIDGGNHSGFAFYGEQKKDNKATISKEEQIDLTSNIIISFIRGASNEEN